MKRAIVKMCLTNALRRSCPHRMQDSIHAQEARLHSSGYPHDVVTSVAGQVLRELKKNRRRSEGEAMVEKEKEKRKVAVIPYIHNIAHRLKKIGNAADVQVVFSAPRKLGALCKKTYLPRKDSHKCSIEHKTKFVPCAKTVIYEIPLPCGKKYVGQTERCLNTRLREHSNNVRTSVKAQLGIHCRDCKGTTRKCIPMFDKCEVIQRHSDQMTREIVEAEKIARLGENCVSVPSVALSAKELHF